MKKIIVLQGVPASGKSTYAKKLHDEDNSKVIISMDALREARGTYWIPEQEAYINAVEEFQVSQALKQGLTPIIDDTNLNPKTINKWKAIAGALGAEIEFKLIKIDYHTACKRDEERGNKVGKKVITSFFEKYFPEELLKPYERDEYTCRNIEEKDPKKLPIIICDLDGTISIMKGRGPFEYNKVHEDLPEWRMVETLKTLSKTYPIIFITGRDGTDECEKLTKEWIYKNFEEEEQRYYFFNGVCYREWNWQLYMRTPDDKRPDYEVKKEIYNNFIKPEYQVINIFEDRDSVVKMWREEGLLCSQVYWGDF
jgi:predicted kinase